MVTFLIASVLILGLLAIAIYFWQKPANSSETIQLPPAVQPRPLFLDASETTTEFEQVEANDHHELFDRLVSGDLGALTDAKGLEVYQEVLNQAVANITSDAQLLKLASHVSQNDLPVNHALAEAMMRSWETAPNRESTAKMLHLAALTNDAALYRIAVEQVLNFWRERKLLDISATELQALFKGEFWLLSAKVRSSGTGFVLKRTLSSARRELEGTTNN